LKKIRERSAEAPTYLTVNSLVERWVGAAVRSGESAKGSVVGCR